MSASPPDWRPRLPRIGWALYQAVSALAYYWETNPGMIRQAGNALNQVLADEPIQRGVT